MADIWKPSMKSPFPRIDPYIEACGLWEDFHSHLIERIAEALSDILPDRYTVRTGERGYVVLSSEEGPKKHGFKPDVSVGVIDSAKGSQTGAATAVANPTTDPMPMSMQALVEEEFREAFIEISDLGEDRLVTSIEILSPSNKKPNTPAWDVYLRKRQGLLVGRRTIDLLRGGQRMPTQGAWPVSPYAFLVGNKDKVPQCLAWLGFFHRPLPRIPIPLLQPDADIWIDLQPMIPAIYSRYRYHHSIDYSQPLTPHPSTEESAWLQECLKQRPSSA